MDESSTELGGVEISHCYVFERELSKQKEHLVQMPGRETQSISY